MPTSVNAVWVLIAFVIPGFVTTRIISFAFPDTEPSEGRLVLTAIMYSCLNYGLLSWLLIWAWFDAWYQIPVRLIGLTVFTLLVSPALLGLAVVKLNDSAWGRRFRETFRIPHPTPKAWDYFFRDGQPCFVVATLKGGRVFAGWYGSNSFASSFPATEDLYLEKLCKLSSQGKMEGIAEFSAGGIVRMENVETLEFFESSKTPVAAGGLK